MEYYALETTCPYCSRTNRAMIDNTLIHDTQKQIINCNKYNGGCGKDYVARVDVNVITKSFKIEGEVEE